MESLELKDEYGVETKLTFNPEVDLFKIIQSDNSDYNKAYTDITISNYPSDVLEKIRDWADKILKEYNR
jgi:V8-like Glu-specific endopeptidase